MKQNKQTKKIVVSILLFSLIAMYGLVPVARAASLTDVSDLITTSAPSAVADHEITFHVATDLVAGDEIWVDFTDGTFAGVAAGNVTCPAGSGSAALEVAGVVSCTATGAISSAAELTFAVSDVTNPAKVEAEEGVADTYRIHIATKTAGGVLIDRADAMVAIIEQVTMSATVLATLEFTIDGVDAGTPINGITTTGTSTATTTPFETLSTAASSTLGQALTVTTNAGDGYIVTVEQDHELLNSSGDTINSFDNQPDGSGTYPPVAWGAPDNTLDDYDTYGHMGVTTSDGDLNGFFGTFDSGNFVGGKYAGLTTGTPMPIMSHNGPADGVTDHRGAASVAYTIEISPLQEAGDYVNTLTYICTPTY